MSTRILGRITLGATVALVTLGAYTRGSGSGFGCRDRWPLCEGGLLGGWLPRADFHMIVEWSHRWLAAIVGMLAVLTAVAAWRSARRWVAVVATVAQAVPASRGWAIWMGFGALAALGLIVAGAYVHNLYVSGWPLVGGEFVPDLSNRFVAVHWLHRVLAALLLVYLGGLAVAVRRGGGFRGDTRLVDLALAAHVVNIGFGAAHVFTEVGSSLLVAGHVLVAAVVWVALVAAAAAVLPVERV